MNHFVNPAKPFRSEKQKIIFQNVKFENLAEELAEALKYNAKRFEPQTICEATK